MTLPIRVRLALGLLAALALAGCATSSIGVDTGVMLDRQPPTIGVPSAGYASSTDQPPAYVKVASR